MKVVSALSHAAPDSLRALSIGNFDGLHLGHQAILRTLVEHARLQGLQPAVLTFNPHPVRVLAPENAPKMIGTFEQKLRWMEDAGVEMVFIAQFDRGFAALEPETFIREYLVDGLGTRLLCVGNNFTFGHRQAGNLATLRQWDSTFKVVEVPAVSIRGKIASSTNVRQFIQEGAVSRAGRLLGRWFEIEGRIVEGEGRGRKETVPTLNLESSNELIPQSGVYITRMALNSQDHADSITNIGVRPTFGGTTQTIETFVLHAPIPANISGVRLQFLRRLRDERKFDSPALLREQIGRDIAAASRFFARIGTHANVQVH